MALSLPIERLINYSARPPGESIAWREGTVSRRPGPAGKGRQRGNPMRRGVLATCVLLVACGEPTTNPLTYEEVQSKISTAMLKNWRDCGYAEPAYVDAELQTSAKTRQTAATLFTIFGGSVESGRLHIDEEALDQCLELLAGPTCVGPVELSPCTRIFVGQVSEGAACSFSQECGSDLYCDLSQLTCPGTCKPAAEAGAEAPTALGCSRGLYPYSGRCAAYVAEGQSCAPVAPSNVLQTCAEGLVCNSASTLCARPAGVSQACQLSTDCEFGLFCAEGVCTRRKGTSEACSDSSSIIPFDCKVGNACVNGLCQLFPGEGESCATFCMPQLMCIQPSSGDDKVCSKLAPIGAACSSSGNGAPLCDGYARCDPASRTCVRYKSAGEACSSSVECDFAECIGGVCASEQCLG
jgi:hypothetical protein